ncbi:hypothetical protein WS86_29070 [Burkholderia savannae]|nr:hypothetical protein WS86_29070 [Burkholderia savannae]
MVELDVRGGVGRTRMPTRTRARFGGPFVKCLGIPFIWRAKALLAPRRNSLRDPHAARRIGVDPSRGGCTASFSKFGQHEPVAQPRRSGARDGTPIQ